LRDQSVEFRVAKNTLLRRAAALANLDIEDAFFAGPTAIVSSVEDEVAAARLMAEAARVPRTPLSIKGGIYGSKAVSAEEVRAIAELPSRETMLARVLGVVQAPAAAALSVAQAPARQVLYAVNARLASAPA
ncbi:MAG TPA: 50S ribosomal protein L10, partial [Chloroflexota bacterium]|nr:50S ribosomal protein L10 [Chloroflexota bacterium]